MRLIKPSFFFLFYFSCMRKLHKSFLHGKILNNPSVWYCRNISTMIKMSNQNITQHVYPATGLSVMIVIRRMLAVFCFRYKNDDLSNHTNQWCQRKTWTREDNQLPPHCYFRGNPTLRGFSKILIETWQESAIFQTISQRFADLVRPMIKKSWFSDLKN